MLWGYLCTYTIACFERLNRTQCRKCSINFIRHQCPCCTQVQHGRDLAQLRGEVGLLMQQVKLKDLVIASYIPRGQQRRIMQASAWDAVQQCWRIAFADVGDGPADAPRCA